MTPPPPLPDPSSRPTFCLISGGFRRGSMSSSNCSGATETGLFLASPQKSCSASRPHLHRAVVEHVQGQLLLVLLLVPQCRQANPRPTTSFSPFRPHLLPELRGVVVLHEDGSPARVLLDLHPQDAVTGPPLSHYFQTVYGRAREGDVNVGKDEENKERLWRPVATESGYQSN